MAGDPSAPSPDVVRLGGGRTVRGWDWRPLAALPAGPLRASVVVLHHEQPAQLARCLAGLAAARPEVDELEVVVADDGSAAPPDADGADVVVRAPHDTTFRAAATRNAGIAASSLPAVVLLDADVVLQPGALAALVRPVAACDHLLVAGTRRHADLAGLGPDEALALLSGADPDAALRRSGRRLPDPAWVDALAARTEGLTRPDPHAYRAVLSAACATSRVLLDGLGGFDERFVGYGGEDWDLAARAVADGALLARPADAVAWHDGPDVARRGWGPADARRQQQRLAPLVPDAALRGGRNGWGLAAVDLVHRVTDVDEDVLARLAAAADAVAGHDVAVRVVGPGARRAADELAGRVTAGDPDHERRRGWLRVDVPGLRALRGSEVARVAALVEEGELGALDLPTGEGGQPVRATTSHARQRLRRLGADPDGAAQLAGVFPSDEVPLAAVADTPVPASGAGAHAWSSVAGPDDAAPDDRPVFVLAAGWRTGSTLVQRLCSSAPGVHVWGEVLDRSDVLDRLERMGAPLGAAWPEPERHGGHPAWRAVAAPPPVALLDAQRALLRTLLARGPAAEAGRWGCKEVRLDAGHAAWLRLLFPRCTVVEVVRDPWDAWCSYRARPGWHWRWPGEPVWSAADFGRNWARLAGSFLDDEARVLVRLEDLRDPAVLDRLDTALGAPVDRAVLDDVRPGSPLPPVPLTARAREVLAVAVGPVADRLGYAPPPLAGTRAPHT